MVCESCLQAAQDESFKLTYQEAVFLAIEMGDQIADHLCDAFENNDGECDCACQLVNTNNTYWYATSLYPFNKGETDDISL